MFGRKQSGQVQQVGDVIEFDVDSHGTAQHLSMQLQQHKCVRQVIILGQTTIRVIFLQFHSNRDKQPVLDLIAVQGILSVS